MIEGKNKMKMLQAWARSIHACKSSRRMIELCSIGQSSRT